MKLLNTAAGNAKILKTQTGSGFQNCIAFLYPNDKICPAAILAGCKAPCLVSAGRGAIRQCRTRPQKQNGPIYGKPRNIRDKA